MTDTVREGGINSSPCAGPYFYKPGSQKKEKGGGK